MKRSRRPAILPELLPEWVNVMLTSDPSPRTVRYREEMAKAFPPSPMIVMNGGLRDGDRIYITNISPEQGALRGVQMLGVRHDESFGWKRLIWQSGMTHFGRDSSGEVIYTPYLRTEDDIEAFVDILSGGTGLDFQSDAKVTTGSKRVYTLKNSVSESVRRIMPGDRIKVVNGGFIVSREQQTVDMNLYQPSEKDDGVILCGRAEYCTSVYHLDALVGILTEANGLRNTPCNSGGFLAVK